MGGGRADGRGLQDTHAITPPQYARGVSSQTGGDAPPPAPSASALAAAPADGSPAAALPDLPPLQIEGLVVAKEDLLAVLRLYVPQVADIEPLDGGRFLLSVRGERGRVAGPPTPGR